MATPKKIVKQQSDLSLAALQKFRVIVQHAQAHSSLIKKKTGISGAQLWLVQEVSDVPGSRIGEIALRMSLKSVTVSNLLEPLLSSGLINREQDAQDRRAFRLYISLKGKRLLAKAPKPTRGILPDTLMHLDSNSLASVDQALALLVEKLSSARARHALEPLPFTL